MTEVQPAMPRTRRVHSGRRIVELLDCEGFTPHVANMLRKWYRHCGSGDRELSFAVAKARWSRLCQTKPLAADQKRVLGKFINQIAEAAFTSGLRLGLSVRVAEAEETTH